MTLQSNAGRLRAHWRLSSSGYDASNARLTDQSGNGNHLPKLAGTPNFGTFGGQPSMEMKGDVYFGGAADFVPTKFTVVMPVFSNLGAGAILQPFHLCQREYAEQAPGGANDPAFTLPLDSFGAGPAFGTWGQRLKFTGTTTVLGGSLQTVDFASATFTANAWNVVQWVLDPDSLQVRIRVGTGAWIVATITSDQRTQVPMFDELRLGYTATPVGAGLFASSQCMIFNGVAPDENASGYASLISALVADPNA
jgi:hypothetical protein